MQVLPNGHAFVGWGSAPYFSEYSEDGELLFDCDGEVLGILELLPRELNLLLRTELLRVAHCDYIN